MLIKTILTERRHGHVCYHYVYRRHSSCVERRVGKVGKEKLIVQPTRQECSTGRDVVVRY